MTIEAEISATGRSRTMVNRQSVRRRGDLHQALRTTVFSPEDIGVVRSGPAERRRFLDETLAVMDPKATRAAEEVEKILRQRTALLRTSGVGSRRRSPTRLMSGMPASTRPAPHWWRPASSWWWSWPRWPRPTTRGWPGQRPISVCTTCARGRGRLLEALADAPEQGRGAGGLDRSGRTATNSSCPWRASQPHPRLPGRTAVPGPRPAARRPPAGHRSAGIGPGPPARRRVLRAGPRSVRGPCWPGSPRGRRS